jgi:hypothetical protein
LDALKIQKGARMSRSVFQYASTSTSSVNSGAHHQSPPRWKSQAKTARCTKKATGETDFAGSD